MSVNYNKAQELYQKYLKYKEQTEHLRKLDLTSFIASRDWLRQLIRIAWREHSKRDIKLLREIYVLLEYEPRFILGEWVVYIENHWVLRQISASEIKLYKKLGFTAFQETNGSRWYVNELIKNYKLRINSPESECYIENLFKLYLP